MSDIKWIKITTGIFDDEKILLIESLPEADSIIVIWFKLLTLAGKQNNDGVLLMNDKIAYTDEMLATIFHRNINTVRLALQTFEKFGMIEIINGAITIPNWEKHQNINGMEKIREQNRQRVAKHRERQKQIGCNVTGNVTVTECNATDKDKDKDKDKEEEEEHRKNIDYQKIIAMYNETCVSLPSVKALNDNRKKAIKARLHTYSIEDFETLFIKSEASDFLKGRNNRNWSATFDWLIKDANMTKVLEGNYDNKPDFRNYKKPDQQEDTRRNSEDIDLTGIYC